MLVAVSLSKPAENDQKQLDDVEQQQKDEQKKQQDDAQKDIQKETQQLVAEGVPQQQAQQQATDDVNKQQKQENEKNQSQEDQTKQQEDFLKTTASDPRLQDLRTDMQKTSGVKSVTQPLVNDSGDAAVYTVISDYAPSSTKTEDVVNDLRDNTIPKATKGQDMTADVGGQTAGYIDLANQISNKLPLTIAVVLALSFLLLLLAFRSVLVPLKAVIMNLLSIAAAFGVVTYVFGHHWSATLVGLDSTVPIVSFVPLMMFAILFGLSMDYEVFLMSHVREAYQETDDPHEAVVDGLATTGRVITSAALIMVSVFCAFLLNGDPNIKQFGLGMAAAVAVDATIVRCLLVPAIMTLLGRAGWWMPRWLDKATPKLSIEGEEWFKERDRKLAAEREKEKGQPPPKRSPPRCGSRTTPSSATSRPPRWWAGTGRSTGCACPASTPAPASPPCSARPSTAAGASPRAPAARPSGAATAPGTLVLERSSTRAEGTVRVIDSMPPARRGRRPRPHRRGPSRPGADAHGAGHPASTTARRCRGCAHDGRARRPWPGPTPLRLRTPVRHPRRGPDARWPSSPSGRATACRSSLTWHPSHRPAPDADRRRERRSTQTERLVARVGGASATYDGAVARTRSALAASRSRR